MEQIAVQTTIKSVTVKATVVRLGPPLADDSRPWEEHTCPCCMATYWTLPAAAVEGTLNG